MLGKLISKICPFFMVPENNPINEEKYLGNRENDNCIYEKDSNKFIFPIITLGDKHLRIVKLSLIDFQGDTIYKCLELQQIIQGTDIYYVVLAYRQDKETDIYYTKGLDISEGNYKSLLNKVTLQELDSIKVNFDVTEKGADIYFLFNDKVNRTIEVRIKEHKDKDDSFSLLAPIGDTSEAPDKFPFIYLKKFVMVQQKGTEIFVRINGKYLKPLKLIPLCNFKKVYLARYSHSINIKELNNDYTGVLRPIEIIDTKGEIAVDNCMYSINMNNGHPEIKNVKAIGNSSVMSMNFSPAIPDIASLKDNTEIQGRFSVSVDEIKGIMGGIYIIKKNSDSISIKMRPQKGWQPMPGRLWVKTYIWNCDIKITQEAYHVKTKWSRKK
ncbi:hypothetical protein ACFDTO_35585 [Microbacteriaceae bacterium 4G12]